MKKWRRVIATLAIGAMLGTSVCLGACAYDRVSANGTVTGDSYQNANVYMVGNFEYTAAQITEIEVDWYVGDIQLVHSDSEVCRVSESGTDLTDDEKLHYWINGTKLYIRFWKSAKVGKIDPDKKNLTVELPQNIDLEVENASGGIQADILNVHNLDLGNISGAISVNTVTAYDVEISTISGGIGMGTITAQSVEMDTTSGGLSVVDIRAARASVESVSGSIDLRSAHVTGELDLDTTSGSIKVAEMNAAVADVESVSGKIDLTVSACTRLDIESTSGAVVLSCPDMSVMYRTTSGKMNTNITYTTVGGRHVFGAGTCAVSVETVSGGLTIK